jgi:hypothetical protein
VARSSGLGDNFYIDGFNMSGDTQALGAVRGGRAAWDVTGIDKSAHERLLLAKEGQITFTTFFNDATTVGAQGAFQTLKGLTTSDRVCSYFRGTTLGNQAASIVAKQINYDGTRGADGSFTFACDAQSNDFGLEWGEQLTAGRRTDGAAANGTGIDFGQVSSLFGWSAYLHVFAFTGTSVTVSIEDSADNATYAALSGAAFTAATGATAQRITSASATATVRRYVRAVTAGTFSNAVFAVNFVRYLTAQG